MKVGIIVQARMSSTRLPGKVLKTVLGKPLLEYQIERLRRVQATDDIIIATTTNDKDEPIVALCKSLNCKFYRGSEVDVLSRYYEAAAKYNIDLVTRVTSDCPVIDPEVIDKVIQYFLSHPDSYDYVSNTRERSYPRGMDTEVFPFLVLKEVFENATSERDREHINPYIYKRPEHFHCGDVTHESDQTRHRWTVDTEDDLKMIKNIITSLYPTQPEFTLMDCLTILEQNPEWEKINYWVEQKKQNHGI